jgi:cell division protein FtsI/penicillin-binding protein 2
MKRAIGVTVAVLALVISARNATSTMATVDADALFTRSAGQTLAREFPDPDISYLLLNAKTGARIARRWANSKEPVPIGSLVKPFTALAYAEAHRYEFPQHRCIGAGSCWLPRGHGELGIVQAIAKSCNAYFAQLAADVSALQVTDVARRFGLAGPSAVAMPEMLVGQYGVWRESPEAIANAYVELLARRSQAGVEQVTEGMAESARAGTAAGVGKANPHLSAFAKTGTAPCTHHPHAPGDGFVVAAWPAELPRYLLLVRLHGRPGAQAAVLAGKMVRALEPAR